MAWVGGNEAMQMGTGSNAPAANGNQSLGGDGSLKYRDTVILEAAGVLGIRAYGNMLLNYAMYKDEFNFGGYIADAATTNVSGNAVGSTRFSETADYGDYLVTVVDGATNGGETITIADAANSILTILTDSTSNDTVQVQMNGEPFQITTNKEMWFQTRVAVTDTTNSLFASGLCLSSATDVLGAAGNDAVYFSMAQGGLVSYHVVQNGTDTTGSTGITFLPGIYHTLAFYWNGEETITISVDGTVVATIVDNGTTILIPDDEDLTAFIAIETKNAAAESCTVDYIGVINTR